MLEKNIRKVDFSARTSNVVFFAVDVIESERRTD